MKVFISWSGDRSNKVAELLEWWLRCVIQAVNPWVSSKHIDRGSQWFNEINDQLATTVTGIVCLTKENHNKPWILFEAGALAKGLSSSRVWTLLIDVNHNDLESPLSQFNHTLPSKDSVFALISSINRALPNNHLSDKILEKCFDTQWPEFDKAFKEIMSTTTEATIEPRKEPEILDEVLSTVRELQRTMRLSEFESRQDMAILLADNTEFRRRLNASTSHYIKLSDYLASNPNSGSASGSEGMGLSRE